MTYRSEDARKEFGPEAAVVFRFLVACCAADARPVAVIALGRPGRPALADNTWVTLHGRFTTRMVRGEKAPIVEEAVLSPAPAPQHSYLY